MSDEDEDDTVRDDTRPADSARTQEMTTVPRSQTLQASPLSVSTERTQLATPAERAHLREASGAALGPAPTKSIALIVIATVVVACLVVFLMSRRGEESAEQREVAPSSPQLAPSSSPSPLAKAAAPETATNSVVVASARTSADARLSVKELNDNCYRHFKEDALELAEQECNLALSKQPDDTQRGAIYYNLGLIARRRGDKAGARALFEKSLQARPKGAAAALVRNAIHSLDEN